MRLITCVTIQWKADSPPAAPPLTPPRVYRVLGALNGCRVAPTLHVPVSHPRPRGPRTGRSAPVRNAHLPNARHWPRAQRARTPLGRSAPAGAVRCQGLLPGAPLCLHRCCTCGGLKQHNTPYGFGRATNSFTTENRGAAPRQNLFPSPDRTPLTIPAHHTTPQRTPQHACRHQCSTASLRHLPRRPWQAWLRLQCGVHWCASGWWVSRCACACGRQWRPPVHAPTRRPVRAVLAAQHTSCVGRPSRPRPSSTSWTPRAARTTPTGLFTTLCTACTIRCVTVCPCATVCVTVCVTVCDRV